MPFDESVMEICGCFGLEIVEMQKYGNQFEKNDKYYIFQKNNNHALIAVQTSNSWEK